MSEQRLTPEELEQLRKVQMAEAWAEWRQLPQTQRLWRVMRKWKEDLKEQWASGKFTDASNIATAMQNANAIGKCELLDRLMTLEWDQMETEEEDETSHAT